MSKSQLDLLRQILGAGAAAADLPLAKVRANFDKLFSRFPTLDDVEVTELDLGGVRTDKIDARAQRDAEPETQIVHIHGGGFVLGSPLSHRNLAARMSRAADAVVFLPDYRLAPEHPLPAQVEDAEAVWRAVCASDAGRAAKRILSGDSAGGCLAVQVAARAVARGESTPHRLVCISPWVDFAATTPSLDRFEAGDPLVDRPGLERMANFYLGGTDPWAPEATPLRADLKGLPPTLIQVGGEETLLDDAKRLAARMDEHGVEVQLDVWEGMTHVWHLFAGRVDESEQAIETVGDWVGAGS